METVVSMLQEDAVALATAPPQKKYCPCWLPTAAPLWDCGGRRTGTRWGGWKRMEQKCVRRSWRNHGRSPGPQTGLPSAGLPGVGGGLTPIALQGRAGCGGEQAPAPPCTRRLPPGLPGEHVPGVPPATGQSAWPKAQLYGRGSKSCVPGYRFPAVPEPEQKAGGISGWG